MRLTLVGHATWLFEHGATRLLTDPVLHDPFEDGTVVSCPARRVDLAGMPTPTAIFLSHRHPDHFHPDSLRHLDRGLPVLMPPDPMLAAALTRLGFARLVPLQPWQPVEVGDLRLTATPSAGDFPECGLLVQADGVSVYDQVDTPLSAESVARLQQLAPALDVHVAMHASQAFGWFDGLPEDLATTHGRNLSVARALGARVVVPGAAGFRFHDDFAWLNRRLFPITEARFVRDLGRLWPEARVETPRPGDVLHLDPGGIRVEEAGADWVTALERDQAAIRPDRTAAVPALRDDGPDRPDLDDALSALVDDLLSAVEDAWTEDPLIRALRGDGVRYHLRVVRPAGPDLHWTVDLSGDTAELHRDVLDAELSRAVAATALLDVAEGRRSCFHLRVRSRRAQAVLTFEEHPRGLAVDQPSVPDLLAWYLVRHRARAAGEDGVLRYYGLA